MNVLILGAPGAGKGTQASMIKDFFGLTHVSTGDIFRENIKGRTELGVLAKGYIDKGMLVPDDLTIALVEGRLAMPDCKNGYLLDGFPRTLAQAEALEEITRVDCVLEIDIDLELLTQRIIGRRICKVCGECYNVTMLDGKRQCAKCGGELIIRPDDTEETVRERLAVYKANTAPLSDYYKSKGLLRKVNGDSPIDDVFAEIKKVLKDQK